MFWLKDGCKMLDEFFDGEGLSLHLVVLKNFSLEFQLGAQVRSKLSGVELADHNFLEFVQDFFCVGRQGVDVVEMSQGGLTALLIKLLYCRI